MKKSFLILISTILLYSCVSKDKYNASLKKNEVLNEKVSKLDRTIKSLKKEREKLKLTLKLEKSNTSRLKRLIEFKKTKEKKEKKETTKYYSEKDALSLLKDFYEFYESDFFYKNPKIRRLSNNKFDISLEEKYGANGNWLSRVRQLTIQKNGEYEML